MSAVLFSGCELKLPNQGDDESGRSDGQQPDEQLAEILTDEGGVLTAYYDANSGTSIRINASSNSAINGASVLGDPGALAISTEITLQEGKGIASESLRSLNINSSVNKTAPAAAVSSKVKQNASDSLVIDIPAPSSNSLALAATGDLVVFYRVYDAEKAKIFEGIILTPDLQLVKGNDGRSLVRFSFSKFGVFQAAYLSKAPSQVVEQESSDPIVAANGTVIYDNNAEHEEDNDAPAISFSAGDATGLAVSLGGGTSASPHALSIDAEATGELVFTLTDGDDDAATLSCQDLPAWVTADAEGATLSFVPSGGEVGNSYEFSCRGYDGAAYSATRLYFSVSVTTTNTAPTFSHASNLNLLSFSGTGTSGDPFAFTVNEDSSNGEVSFTIADVDGQASALIVCGSLPGWVTVDDTNDKITFAPANDDVGSGQAFSCQAHDGIAGSATTLYFSVDVANVNDAPALSYSSHGNLSGFSGAGVSGDPYSFSVNEDSTSGYVSFTASDIDGDATTINCTAAPAFVAVDNVNDKITFNPMNADVGAGQTFSCLADDAQLNSASIYFSVTVTNVNDAPTLTYSANAGISGFAGAGSSLTPYSFSVAEDSSSGAISFAVADDDGGTPDIVCSGAPTWVSVDNGNDKITFSPVNEDVGSGLTFSCYADDSVAQSASIYFDATVTNVNDAPSFAYDSSANIGSVSGTGTSIDPYTFNVTVSTTNGEIGFTVDDVDTGDTVTINCASGPTWLVIDNGSDRITFSPLAGDLGSTASFNCSATDGTANSASLYFSGTVVSANTAPNFILTGSSGVTYLEGLGTSSDPYTLNVVDGGTEYLEFDKSDPQGDATTITCSPLPTWATLDDGLARITFSASTPNVSATPVTFDCQNSDSSLTSDTLYFSVVVQEPTAEGAEMWSFVADTPTTAGSVAIDSRDHIYATANSGSSWQLHKFHHNGGGSPLWTTAAASGTAHAVKYDSVTNAVYVAGSVTNTDLDWFVKKFDLTGTEITDENWPVSVGSGNGADEALALAVDSNGYVYAVGYGTDLMGSTNADLWIKKYSSTGTEVWQAKKDNSTYGTGGVDRMTSIVVNSADEIIVGGYSTWSDSDWWILKYAVGTGSSMTEITTGTWAARTIDGGFSGNDEIYAMSINPADDTVYVVGKGFTSNNRGDQFWIRAYLADGTDDTTNWGVTGSWNGDANSLNDAMVAVAWSAKNQRLYTAAYSQQITTGLDWAISETTSAGNGAWDITNWDTAFDLGGSVDDAPAAMVADSEGNLIIVGYGTNVYGASSGSDFVIKKFKGE